MRVAKGTCYRWLLDHVEHHGSECLIWPFGIDKHGRGRVGHEGESFRAHRLMCILKRGEPPSPQHTAAHSCGKGHFGCVHPEHLHWKTQAGNMADAILHGTTARSGMRRTFKPQQIAEIRRLLSEKSQLEVAEIFGVHESTINNIATGRTYTKARAYEGWSASDEAALRAASERGDPVELIAKAFGRTRDAIHSKAARMGLPIGG